ncbi:MAG: hypothetical protein EYC69_04260 [Bacteroidetes bacterium]|nr:MAG: hypothetical protein EYC69_04260 [Bacteroidota bacterium]
MNSISKKKQSYRVSEELFIYLEDFGRVESLPFRYQDLLRFNFAIPLLDKFGKDTLWETVFYQPVETEELNQRLVQTYALMKVEGDMRLMEHLYVDRIDFCPFGNSKPFRIRIKNQFNDNYDYYYVKLADASRVYGLEFEDLLSPNRINFLVDSDTLVEEHIIGIPGDQFAHSNLLEPEINRTRLAKEFIKFNERCFVRLLGDMRSYNFVIDMTLDFDDTQFRFRAIDFDQQSYEGRKALYLPQYFKENNPYVDLCVKFINKETAKQYQLEERSLMARRLKIAHFRLAALLEVMIQDTVSLKDKTEQLRRELAEHYKKESFLKCRNMGEIMRLSLNLLLEHSA